MEWMIQIEPLQNGAHRMQTNPGRKIPPLGYAFIPPEMIIPKGAPFVDIEVAEEIRYDEFRRYDEEHDEETVERIPYTVMVVTSMTEGVVPEVQPIHKADEGNKAVTWNELAEAYVKGVNSIDE